MRPSNDRARPAANGTGSNVISDGDDLSLDADRCSRCGREIHAARSLAVGMGKDCRRIGRGEVAA